MKKYICIYIFSDLGLVREDGLGVGVHGVLVLALFVPAFKEIYYTERS
jgi:hypothetical protein